MFYHEAMPTPWFVSRVHLLLTIGDRHWQILVVMFEKAKSANLLAFA